MKYKVGLLLMTFTAIASSRDIVYPLEPPVGSTGSGTVDPDHSYTDYHEQYATIIGEKWVKEGSEFSLVAKGANTTNHVADFYASMEPLSQNALNVGTNTSVPFVTYNEMTGLLTAKLPAIGMDDISITPQYVAPGKSSPVDLLDPFAGSSGRLGVGWHFGLGHLVVTRRPVVERMWSDENHTHCTWQPQGYESIYGVDGAGRESQFAKQYLTVADDAFEDDNGVKRHFIFPGSVRRSNIDEGVHAYFSSARESSFVNPAGSILSREQSTSDWNVKPPSAQGDNPQCTSFLPGYKPNEAKVLTKDSENRDKWFQEYGWFDYTMHQPDGSKVVYRAELASLEQANQVASRTVDGELSDDLNLKQPVYFHPAEIIQKNGVSYTIAYEGDNQCASSGYSHCIGSRKIKSIKKTGVSGAKAAELVFSYTNSGLVDKIHLNKDGASVQLASFDYTALDGENYLSGFSDGENRLHKIFYEGSKPKGYRWITGVSSPLSNATTAADATTYIQYDDVTDIPVGAYFPRGCSMRPATVDFRATGVVIDGMDQWSLDSNTDPSRENQEASCDPVLYGEANYNKRRVSTISAADKTITFSYTLHDRGLNAEADSRIAEQVDYQLLKHDRGTLNEDENFLCAADNNCVSQTTENLLKVDALYEVVKQTQSSYETEKTTTYYASYAGLYDYPASRKMGHLAGKPLIQITQVKNDRQGAAGFGNDYKNTIRKEWYWDFVDVFKSNEFSPGAYGGNPVTQKFRAGVKIMKEATAVYHDNFGQPTLNRSYDNDEASYTLYNYGGIKTGESGEHSAATYTATRLKAMFAKPKSIYSISKLGVEPNSYYGRGYEKTITNPKYTSNFSFYIGNDDFSVYQMNLPVAKTVCTTRDSVCKLTDPSTRLLSKTESQYQKYSSLNGLYLPGTTKSYRDAAAATATGALAPFTTAFQFFGDNGGFENKGMLSSVTTGNETTTFSNYVAGQPTQVTKDNWQSPLTFNHFLLSSGFVSESFSRSGAKSEQRIDLVGREIYAQQDGFLGMVTQHSELPGLGLEVSQQLEGGMVHLTDVHDVFGRKIASEHTFTDTSGKAITSYAAQGLGLYEETHNAKGGKIQIYKDILGRPVLRVATDNGTKDSETYFRYAMIIDTVGNGEVTYNKTADKHHKVFNTAVYDMQHADHSTYTKTNLQGEVLSARQCNADNTDCASDNVEIEYETTTHTDIYTDQKYVGVIKQIARTKRHEDGTTFGERIRISDLMGNLLYEDNPEIGEIYYRYDQQGRLSSYDNTDGMQVTNEYREGDLLDKVTFYNPHANPSKPKYIVDYHYDDANGRLLKTTAYYEGTDSKVVETFDYRPQSDKMSEKQVSIPAVKRGPDDLRPRYIEDYNALNDSLTLRWNSPLVDVTYQLEFTNKSLTTGGQSQSVVFDKIGQNSFELTKQKLMDAITKQLGSDSPWLAEFADGAEPILPTSTYEWRVMGYDNSTYEPFASSQKSVLTNDCQILEFDSVSGFGQGPLLKWDTRGCEGLTTAVLVTTHTVAKNSSNPDDDCRIDDGVFSGYKRGPQRAHFLYNGYNKADIIAAEEGDSSSTPVWTGDKQCFGSPTVPDKRLEEVTFRLAVLEGGDGLIKNKQELMSSRRIIARLNYDENACHIRNFQTKHGEGELTYNASTGSWFSDGSWTAPSVTFEAVNCENKHIELKIDAIDTRCPVNERIEVGQSGSHKAQSLAVCGNQGGASFQLEVREGYNYDADVLDESQTLEAMNAPQLTVAGGCYISDFSATDGDDNNKPTITWNTAGCDGKDVSLVYNAVAPGVDTNCQLRDYPFTSGLNGDKVNAEFMYQPYTVDANGQRVEATLSTPDVCQPMDSADVWLEVREPGSGILIADTPPWDVAYSGEWEAACELLDFKVDNFDVPGQLPVVTWATNCGSDVSVRVLTTVTGSADSQCDLDRQLWDGHKSGGREVKFMLGGYAANCPPVTSANFEVELVNPVNEAVIERSETLSVNFIPDGTFDKACDIERFRVIDRGAGLLPQVDVDIKRDSSCAATDVKLMFQALDPGLSQQCSEAKYLINISSGYTNLLHNMKSTGGCPAVKDAKLWVEQYDGEKMVAHSSFVDARYLHEQQCQINSFEVTNSSVPGELPVVSWSTNCSGQSVQVKTASVGITEPAECVLNGALWDGNKSLPYGRTVDFMVGGWGVTPNNTWGCPAMDKADFWIEIYDGGHLTQVSPTKRAEFQPVAPSCNIDNSSFYVEGTGENSAPKVHYYTNCNDDVNVYLMFSYSGDSTRHKLYNMSQSGTLGLNVYELSANQEGWVWIEIRDKSENLMRRTDYKKADFGMALNSQSTITVSPSDAEDNNI